MKKRILSILLLCCMVLTMLPTTVLAADGPMDTIPKYDVSIDVYNRTSDISIKDSRSYYIYSSVPDKLRDTWAWDKKIFIKGDKTAPHVFIDGVNIEMSPSSKGPAIELNKKASAYLYFIGKDSTLQGADGRAAIQKNRSEGQLYVLARTGTTVTCKGGYRAAGIGGSWAIRNIGDSMFNMDMYGHGVNMHFGSQSNPDYWGGTINATGGEYGAGIGAGSWGHSGHSGNTIHGGAGERLYFYSGTVNASGGRLAAGIGGGFRGRGSHIYIYGGNIDAQGGDTGAGIGGGSWTTKQDMDGINAASDIVISGGRVSARGQYNCAGIGGGQYVPARNITITGGHVSATGHYGAAIGGGRWCHGKNITITDATLNLSTNYRSNGSDAAAVGYGDIVYKPEQLVADPSIATNDQIRIGSYKGKLVKLKLEARALSRDDEYSYFWNLYETLIPDENGLIDMQLLTLPYVQNYGWAINVLEMTVIDDPCNGNHDFGWVNRQSCHVWACRNKDCQARDPAAEMSKQNGKHIPGDWGTQEKHCAVCDHLLEKDTAAPVLEVLNDGESYTVEDVIVGRPGAYSFTVSDPAKSGEASSGVKSVTINGVEQKADSTYYSLPAPDGGNNDAGAEYTVVATDNAGNASTATVKIYRRHRVRVVSPDEQTTYAEAELAHNEYLVLTMKMPDGAAVRMTDKADHSEIPYDKEMGRFTVGLIDRSRTLVLEYNTEYPKAELILGRSQYFFGYNADTAEPHYLKDVSRKTDKNVYSVAVQINADVIPSHYFSSPVCYTQEELAELDKQGKIAWEKYQHPEPEPGVWIVYIPTATIDIAEYDANGSWYVYAKAENLKGTTYVSTPKLIADVEKPKAINLSTGKELETDGEYWGDLRFRVEDALPVKVWHERYPGGNIELMTPDEDGCYTIPADYDVTLHHDICIEDACGNKTYYNDIDILWNYLEVVREKDYWDVQPAQPIRISREQDLQEELSKVNIGVFASDVTGFIPVDVSWEIPEDYDPQSPREQTFTVLGTVILEGTGARCVSGLDVITRPGEEWKKNFAISVTVEGAPRYKVTTEDSANGSVTVVNATETTEDGTPLFYKDELVMLSIAPDEGYMLSTLSVNGTAAAVAVGEDAYTFAQPEENVTITATFEKRNEHTVTFDANGGSEPKDLPEEVTTAMPAKKVLHGSEYCLPECEFIAPEGKQFKAWQIGDSEYAVNDPVTVTADITVKALWEDAPPAPAEYTVRFNANGGGGTMADVTGISGSYTLPACGFTEPEGKQFKGWSTSADGSVISGTTYEVSLDTTFYAIWESKEYPIIVADGKATIGAGSEISKAAQGTTITLTANAAPDGKVFDKWVVESGSAALEDANSETTTFIMPAEAVSVKATYKGAPHTHTFDQETIKDEALKSAADCTNDAVYYKSCACGEISTTETFTAADTALGHDWATDWNKDADNHWKECSRCHEKKDNAAHDYGEDNICDTCGYDKTVPHTHNLTLVPAKAPTCTEKGNTAYYTCDGCDKWFEDATGASEITDKTSVILAATGHSASDWKSDNTDHWKECTVVGCGVIIEDSKAAHTAGEWIIDTPATATTSGSKHKECTVCGYTMATETIPATGGGEHTHSYGSEWKNDADNHWHECSCGDKKDTAAHTAGEWIIDTPATATTDGSKHKECTVCGYTMTIETIPATGGGEHTHSYGSDWKNDATNHWHECSCGDKADKAAHDFKWVVDKEATATQKGSKHEECRVCGYKKAAVEIPATGTPTEPGKPTDSDSPQTGDNSNMILWIALLFVSGGVVIGITVYSKKKKENAE
ncbi:InlB B-repeat-containing protein [Hominenteromicrobium sp.]|uniref:InlB B-repeat-containing protein n=1 Tax=Hominenteromicrobium sp. TaxID=3073581 RepID=UPI003AF1C217